MHQILKKAVGSEMARIPGWKQAPIVNMEQAYHWQAYSDEDKVAALKNTVYTDARVSGNGFVTYVEDSSMAPAFPRGTMLVVDADKQASDRSFVLARINGQKDAIFRQLLVNTNQYYLRPCSPELADFPMAEIRPEDVIGVVVQSRRDFVE